MYLSLIKISSISFGKDFLIHHICSRFDPIRDLLFLEVQNSLQRIFSRYLKRNSPSYYWPVEISTTFHFDICCNNLLCFFVVAVVVFVYSRYDIQILPVLLTGHQIYSSDTFKCYKRVLEFGTALEYFKACYVFLYCPWLSIM